MCNTAAPGLSREKRRGRCLLSGGIVLRAAAFFGVKMQFNHKSSLNSCVANQNAAEWNHRLDRGNCFGENNIAWNISQRRNEIVRKIQHGETVVLDGKIAAPSVFVLRFADGQLREIRYMDAE